jgi:hypothetical protein
VAEERVVEEAVALLVGLGGLLDDGASVLERVLPLPGHGAVARLARDGDLDLHPPALAAVDAERAALAAAVPSVRMTTSGITSGPAVGKTSRPRYIGPAPSLSSSQAVP